MSPSRSLIGPACLTALLTSLLLPAAARAQAKTQLVPFFASYYALAPYGTDIDEFGSQPFFDERMSNAPTIGARLSFAISQTLGIEGQVAFNSSGRQANPTDNSPAGFYLKGNEVLASGRFTYHPRRSNFRLIGGVGYMKRGGDGWDESKFGGGFTFDKSIIGGVVGFGAQANLTARLSLDLDVEAFLYSSDADQDATTFVSKFQSDILVSIGVPIKFGK